MEQFFYNMATTTWTLKHILFVTETLIQPRSQGLLSNRPLRRARRDPGNEIDAYLVSKFVKI